MKILSQRSSIDAQKVPGAIAVLLRNTTWKCGKVERLVVSYLRLQFRRCGRARTSIKDMLEYFKLKGEQGCGFLEAIERLERRRIIQIVPFHFSSPPEFNALIREGGL